MRISTVTQNLRIDNSITSIQRKIADAQQQISTGKKSQVYSGFSGQDVRLLVSLKEQRTSVQSYVDTINNTKVKTTTIDASLVTFTDITQDLRKKMYEQVEGLFDNSSLALATYANAAIDQLTNLLNQTSGGQFLFNGADTDTQPLLSATASKAAYAAHVFGALGPGQPALSAGAGATDVIAFVEDFFSTDANWNNVTAPAPGSLQARIDKGVDVSFGELGNDDAFEEVFEVLYAFANANFQAGDDTEYQALVTWGLGKVEAAFDLINDMVGQNGVIGAQLETNLEAHREGLTLLETQVLDIEDVDAYEAVSLFQTLQAQLESSFQTTALLRNLSLTKYI
ncbi:flagellar hook-associated protein [alpha proteobacterium BAL199]|jgi:flagellar hook-associated protein 3 FlgL|nr:flagellar hook-associated protein [alpha proteobacterium BAL199]